MLSKAAGFQSGEIKDCINTVQPANEPLHSKLSSSALLAIMQHFMLSQMVTVVSPGHATCLPDMPCHCRAALKNQAALIHAAYAVGHAAYACTICSSPAEAR